MKPLTIARIELVRTLRDRRGLFFLAVLPMVLIVVLGMMYGGNGTARIGVVVTTPGPIATDLVDGIRAIPLRSTLRTYETPADLRDAVERGYVEVGVIIPADFDAALTSGSRATIEYVAQVMTAASAVRAAVEQAVTDEASLVSAARATAQATGTSFDAAYRAARDHRPDVPAVAAATAFVGTQSAQVSGYTLGAQTQLILFMFLSALTAALALIDTRELGVARRMFSTPTSARTIVLGETLGRFLVSLSQGVFIVLVSWVAFGVDWVDPWATSAIVVAFALVATGAAMAIGSFARSSQQASSLAPGVGMMLGLLGGCMVPPEIFPPVMVTVSHLTPHAWALDAFRHLVNEGGGFVGVLPDIAVLLGFAAVLLGASVVRFRRVLVTTG